jgi:hypothetical protein
MDITFTYQIHDNRDNIQDLIHQHAEENIYLISNRTPNKGVIQMQEPNIILYLNEVIDINEIEIIRTRHEWNLDPFLTDDDNNLIATRTSNLFKMIFFDIKEPEI